MSTFKKILNWFFGSFFRSFGRFFAFFVLGIVFFSLINTNFNIKKTFKNLIYYVLGVQNVYAYETSGFGTAEYMDITVPLNNTGCFNTSTETSSSWYNFGTEHTFGNRRFVASTRALIRSGSYTWSKGNTYTIKFTLSINPKYYDEWKNHYSNLRVEGCTSTSSSSCNSSNLDNNASQLVFGNDTSSNYWVWYEITFVPTANIKMLWFEFNWRGNSYINNACVGGRSVSREWSWVDFQWYRVDWVRYVANNDYQVISNSINNQTNIINQNFDRTNEFIKDVEDSINNLTDYLSDDTLNDNTLQNYINQFRDPNVQAFGPLSGFLTLPLTWVQNLLSSSNSCSPLSFPLPYLDNKYLTLPCMTDFWNSLGALKLLVELLWYAVIGSRIFNLFYKVTLEVFNTDDDSYDRMTKLKEWEL